MKKQVTLMLAATALVCASAWSQTTANATHAGNDSLIGFNADSVREIIRHANLAPFEADRFMTLSEKTFIAQKYNINGYNDNQRTVLPPQTPQSACTNMGFETGDFTGWQGAIGDNMTSSYGPLTNIQPGIFSTTMNAPLTDMNARHTIMSSAAGNDPCGGFPIVPANYGQYVARIGESYANYQGEILEQTFVVDASNTQFTYRYAVVLNDGGHSPGEQPYFKIEVLDSLGQPVSPCSQYYVQAGGSVPGFVTCPSDPFTSYKPWSTVTVDLSNYINHSVTMRFTAGGCIYGGHYAYAYIDCACGNIGDAVSATICPGSPGAFLIAPNGFGSYQWYDSHGNLIPGATNDSLFVASAQANDTFTVNMSSISDSSCHTILPVVVQLMLLQTNTVSQDVLCFGGSDGTATESCANCLPPVSYTWSNSQTGATATNLAAGIYYVTIVDSIGCTDIDTAIVNQPPRLDTAGITTQFCVGDQEITLIGVPGQPGYQWADQNGPIAGANGQTYLLTNPQLGDIYYVTYNTTPCPILDSIIITYVPPKALFMPDSTVNVFTPNGDNRNDYFYPYFDQSVSGQSAIANGQPEYDFHDLYVGTYEIWVYNRWGQEVFYSNDYNVGWDGKINGNEAAAGVYYWVAKFTSRCKTDMEPIVNTGFVHLIRDKK